MELYHCLCHLVKEVKNESMRAAWALAGFEAQFLKSDHENLCNILNSIKGKFLLYYNDCDYIRELYSGFTVIPIERQNSLVRTANAGKYKEVLIKNYS